MTAFFTHVHGSLAYHDHRTDRSDHGTDSGNNSERHAQQQRCLPSGALVLSFSGIESESRPSVLERLPFRTLHLRQERALNLPNHRVHPRNCKE